jgi:predicted regulator of Ras-like GTPase activity (Roadblock/LC7/MglB family)
MADAQATDRRSLEILEAQYESLFDRIPGLYGVLFSTADGDPVSSRFQADMQRERLAAMSSSLVALGETMAKEAQQRACDYVIVQSTDGYVVSLRIGKRLLLTAFASKDTNLGMLLSSCQGTAENMSAKLQRRNTTDKKGRQANGQD